ncbi:hypothetical protein QCA50_001435 [Cerrena zonata]|uniref:Uncharacterized protein n=1 Tax=Cerrena zonata TaxID=2478898 RepID=A0AAW0GX35_9APHY
MTSSVNVRLLGKLSKRLCNCGSQFDLIFRDYPPADYRGRPMSPPPSSRYADYPPRAGSSEAPPPRYRRRSQSPPARSGAGIHDSGYAPSSTGATYSGSTAGGFAGNSYSGGGAPATSRGGTTTRDYPPTRARENESGNYRRP